MNLLHSVALPRFSFQAAAAEQQEWDMWTFSRKAKYYLTLFKRDNRWGDCFSKQSSPMDIAVTILQKEGGEKISAASGKGNPGKTNKLGSFKQANDCPKLFMHNNICSVTSFHFFYGWFSWIFRWVLSDHVPSPGSFALLQSMDRNLLKQLGNSWHQDPKGNASRGEAMLFATYPCPSHHHGKQNVERILPFLACNAIHICKYISSLLFSFWQWINY